MSPICWRRLITGLLILAMPGLWPAGITAQPSSLPYVSVGVLSFEPKPATLEKWGPTVRYLQQEIKRTFKIVPLDYDELNVAVKSRRVDFVLTNPEHYVVLRNSYGLSPVATLRAKVAGQPVNTFGGVIFRLRRSGSSEQENLENLKGRRIAAVGLYSLGGFLAQADEFRKRGVDLQSAQIKLKFLGTPHDKVVEAVLAGQADVGLVRTGVLERMAEQGLLDLSKMQVLNQQPAKKYPLLLSTELYPEWPFAAMPQTDPELVKQVDLALLGIAKDSSMAQAGGYLGFGPPANYAGVEELLRRMVVYPSLDPIPFWRAAWQLYEDELEIAVFLLGLAGMATGVYLWFANRRLRRLQRLYNQAQTGLKVTAAAFESQIGIIVTDSQTRIIRANDAFCALFDCNESEILGRPTRILRSPSLEHGTLSAIWKEVQTSGRWRGQLSCPRQDGVEIPCIVAIKALWDASGQNNGFVGSFIDISVQLRAEAQAQRLAHYDPLTGLPNRRLFIERLSVEISRMSAGGGLGALLFIDLDEFKELNDTYGHVMGDQLLCDVASRLRGVATSNVLAGRLGGDEFVMMLTDLDSQTDAALERAYLLATEVRKSILEPYKISLPGSIDLTERTLHYRISGSIGVALFGQQLEATSEVFRRADVAMYLAKQSGKNAVKAYDEQAQKLLVGRVALGSDLAHALSRDQLSLYLQVQTMPDGKPIGAECLLRWFHPERGMVSPTEFIPIAESSGAILAIGDWVLDKACQTLARWAHDSLLAPLRLSINVSPRQFAEADFVQRLETILTRTGVKSNRLCLEITEGIVLQEVEQTIEKMRALQRLGVSFSVDDFGTGYSSLAYLHRLPLREVKIDKTFVSNIPGDPHSVAIARAILAMSESMGFEALAEGIETPQQLEALESMGCQRFQGYLFGKPVAIEEFERKLRG